MTGGVILSEENDETDGDVVDVETVTSVESLLATTYDDQVTIDVTENYDYAKQVYELVNEERVDAGKTEVALDAYYTQVAMERAAQCALYFSHTLPTGGGISFYALTGGENVAAGHTTPEAVMEDWMSDSGHKQNILAGNWTKVGIGCVKVGSVYYWVQVFGTGTASGTVADGTNDTTYTLSLDYDYVPLDDMTFRNANTTLELGETETLAVSVTNAGWGSAYTPINASSFTWASSDPSVCTVSSTGVITAVGTGTATITATTQGGKVCSQDFTITLISQKAPASGTGYTIDYENETVTAAEGYEISTDKGATWKTSSDGPQSVTPGGCIYVRFPGTDTMSPSKPRVNGVSDRPTTPSATACDESVTGKCDGKISGLAIGSGLAYEYSADGGSTWITASKGYYIYNLAPGTYQVRKKATTTSFASLATTVTVGKGVDKTYELTMTAPTFSSVEYGYSQPSTAKIMVTNSGNSAVTVTAIKLSNKSVFPIDDLYGTLELEAGNSFGVKIQPKTGLSVGTYTTTFTIIYGADADHATKTATATVTFQVTKASQSISSTLYKTYVTTAGGSDGKILGLDKTKTYEYSSDGGKTWKTVSGTKSITGLKAGTYQLRLAETSNAYASKEISVTIEEKITSSSSNTNTSTNTNKNTSTNTNTNTNANTSTSTNTNTNVTTQAMYRLYNPNSGEHFYTASDTERKNLVKVGWNYEGIAWNAPTTSDTPVYRLYNPNAGDHHYTMSATERDNLVKVGWKYEGIGWYSESNSGQVLYRLYNPNAVAAGAHHYTGSTTERDNLVKLGWNYEGVGWYGVK